VHSLSQSEIDLNQESQTKMKEDTMIKTASIIFGGYGLVTGKSWGLRADLAALGMLLYCTIFSIGTFGQAGNFPAAIFFIVIAILALAFSTRFILESVKGGAQ